MKQNKTIYRNLIKHLSVFVCMLALLTACQDETLIDNSWEVNEKGEVLVTFNAQMCEEQQVATRAIDSDGKAIQTFWLFCFDEFDGFIGRAKASGFEINGTTQTAGTFKALIPSNTNSIHFMANVNMDGFNDYDYLAASESNVIGNLTANSGRLTYWGRNTYSGGINNTNKNQLVTLYRSQASILVESAVNAFKFEGFSICNYWLTGTIAPSRREALTADEAFNWSPSAPFVTLPANGIIGQNQKDVSKAELKEQFLFEHENTSDNPMFLIVKGNSESAKGSFYYKLQIVDPNKNFYPINRNYQYKVTFQGDPGKGYATHDKAVNGVPLNNQLFNIDPTLPSISSDKESLKIEIGTTVVVSNQSTLTEEVIDGETYYRFNIPYSYSIYDEKTDSYSEKPLDETTWVANDNLAKELNINTDVENKNIKVYLKNRPQDDLRIIKLRARASSLSREVTIYIVNEFNFEPVFVTNKLEKTIGSANEATYTFCIPESYPTTLFPIECKIMTKYLNPTEELPLEFEEDGTGYKFIKKIEAPGVYTMTFKNVVGNENSGTIQIEADHFATVESSFNYVSSLTKLSSTKSELDIKPIRNEQTLFNLTAKAGETITLHTRYQTLISPTPSSVTTNNGLKSYTFTASASNNITLQSDKPACEEVITIEGSESKSLMIPIINSEPSYTFNLKINGASTTEVDYKTELTPIELEFNIPAGAVKSTGEHFSYYLFCKNLDIVSIPSGATLTRIAAGYIYTPATTGNQTLNFKTNTVASAESIRLFTDDKEIVFTEEIVNYTNTPIKGNIVYGPVNDIFENVPAGHFVAVENVSGIRVGLINFTTDGKYELSFYPDYNLGTTGNIYISYAPGTGFIYQMKTSVDELYTNSEIKLVRS